MKKTKILYWVFTGLFAAFMLLTAIPDILSTPDAVVFMTHLGYPAYLIRFLGIAKLLGVIAILMPGASRVKDWAYAGLAFDLIGAAYSIGAVGASIGGCIFMLVPLTLEGLSYVFYIRKTTFSQPLTSAISQ